ncbi:flagellar export protein FliJ [Thalassotalea fusca]
MSLGQIYTLHKFESDKERKAAQDLQHAEQDYQQNLLRLQSVGEYRLEYMKRLEQRSLSGVDSATYKHFHAFITKLDNAAEQVEVAISQSKALVEQKKTLWLAQRQKVKAVELLLEKRQAILDRKANKLEQKMFDEIATQRFVRQSSI